MQWGCWTSYFVEPANNTLAHRLLLSGGTGAAAVLGATTLTEAPSERALSLEIFSRIFEPGATLGQVVLESKRSLAAGGDPAVLDVLVGWNLLGDPTLGIGGEGSGGATDLPFENGFEVGRPALVVDAAVAGPPDRSRSFSDPGCRSTPGRFANARATCVKCPSTTLLGSRPKDGFSPGYLGGGASLLSSGNHARAASPPGGGR